MTSKVGDITNPGVCLVAVDNSNRDAWNVVFVQQLLHEVGKLLSQRIVGGGFALQRGWLGLVRCRHFRLLRFVVIEVNQDQQRGDWTALRWIL